MAQDFGDDMGNALLNFVTRQTENYLRFGRGRERAFDWWQRHYKKEGNTPEQAKAMAEKQSSREQVVVPFGTSEEAAYYAQVCRENGTYAAAYTDKQGNGFLAFAKEDAETVAGYATQFKDVMARLDEQRITDALNHAEPVNKKTMDSLTELTGYPDLPAEDVTVIPVTIRYKDAPESSTSCLQAVIRIRKRAVREKECHGLGHHPILRQETPSSRGAHLFQSRSAYCQYLFETFACPFDFACCAAPRPSGTQLIVKRVPTPLEKLCHVSDRHLALEPIRAEREIAFREDFHFRISVTLMQPETVGEQGFPFPDGIVFHIVRHIFHPSLPSD